MSAAEIAKALHGRPNGRGYLCCCPTRSHGQGRGDLNPSLSVADGDMPGRVLITCFSGCTRRDVLAELRARGLLDDRDREPVSRPPRAAPPEPPEPEPDSEALELWRRAEPTAGTLAATYLAVHRGLEGPAPPTLRFARSVLYRPAGIRIPALIAAVQRPDRAVIALQATFLRSSDGAKAPVSVPRMTVGALGNGAVRLGAAGPMLGVAEGVETGLSAMAMTGVPVWCALGAARLHRVRVPDEVREVVIFADSDNAGQRAADRTAELHTKAGRRVVIRTPIDASDWNDVLRALGKEAA